MHHLKEASAGTELSFSPEWTEALNSEGGGERLGILKVQQDLNPVLLLFPQIIPDELKAKVWNAFLCFTHQGLPLGGKRKGKECALQPLPTPCSDGIISLWPYRSDSLEKWGQLDAAPLWPIKCHWEPQPETMGEGKGHFRTVENIPFPLSMLGPCFLPYC